jgi:hypothetical protein
MYRLLLEDVFGLPADALGFPTDDESEPSHALGPLVRRARQAAEPSPEVLDYFGKQLADHTRLDNLVGPSYVLPTALGQLDMLEQLAERGAPEAARLAARYAEFTGWLLQDSGHPARALAVTTKAVDYADASGDVELST